jgi:hypothetical protein
MGRSGGKSSKAASRPNNAAASAAALFDSTELRVQHTEQLRQVSDGILELTQSSGESVEFAPAVRAPLSGASRSPIKSSKRQHPTNATAKGDRGSRHGSSSWTATAAAVALSSPTLTGPSKRKQPKSRLSSSVERSDPVEADTAPESAAVPANPKKEDEGPANQSTPIVGNDKDDEAASPSPIVASSLRKDASRGGVAVTSTTSDSDDAVADDSLVLPPGAYSVRPGASTSVLDEPESASENDDGEDGPVVQPSGSRSVESSPSVAAVSADAAPMTATTPTVTATAVTRDDLEQEVRERILREAVVAEVMVAAEAVGPPNSATSLASQPQPSQPSSVPDGFFTSSKPSVPDGFFTSPNTSGDSTASFNLPEAPLDHDDEKNKRDGGGCASCSPCCYAWRWGWSLAWCSRPKTATRPRRKKVPISSLCPATTTTAASTTFAVRLPLPLKSLRRRLRPRLCRP